MAKATLILALLATVAATVPASAAPRTVVCGPFTPTAPNVKPAKLGTLAFVVDVDANTAKLVDPSGKRADARIEAKSEHAISIVFFNSDVMGDNTDYQVDISNDHGGATLATYLDSGKPFAKGQCRPGGNVVF